MSEVVELLRGLGGRWLELGVLAVAFCALALIVKRGRALADGRAAAAQTRINLVITVIDQITVTPLVVLAMTAVTAALTAANLVAPTAGLWERLGFGVTGIVALVIGDFLGYWRHRVQHSRLLWPAHAIHHSDTNLTWFSLERIHPVDRLGTAVDPILMALMGFPVWAISLTVLARHYWGYFIHADVPWSLGKAGLILNSPILHRWHHARDVEGSGSNFATLFSIFDRAFGTLHDPGPCTAPLGVREPMGRGALGQYLHPFRVWGAAIAQIRSRSQATRGASAGGIG
ncbi:sterol desaturase family protein [Phenylobacterium sp.]|uniref:sterol desaturase family protein n=1 Tax=Phenylobacterium sp. TaxID=1871053 RepID=UPI00273602C8|nr:sterol desaturase family protein [Phenylobacterium sp.]MDP3659200.1 sterol desaturase family protein [Phenylobacterium sp.]